MAKKKILPAVHSSKDGLAMPITSTGWPHLLSDWLLFSAWGQIINRLGQDHIVIEWGSLGDEVLSVVEMYKWGPHSPPHPLEVLAEAAL